jgi:hypothetical protein
MNRTLVFASIAMLLAVAQFAGAARREITMDMINTTLPEEGAPLAIRGKYEPKSEIAFGSPGHLVFYPANLELLPRGGTLPLLVWGNGGCGIDTSRYSELLGTVVSHGFVAIGTATQAGAAPRRATADDLLAAIAWAEKENARDGSPLKGKSDLTKIAAMGQSCGGFLAIALGADPRVDTIGVFNAGVKTPDPDEPETPAPEVGALAKLHGPVLFVNGNDRDFLWDQSKYAFASVATLPTFYGSRHGAGHTATAFHKGGGEFANVASNWLLWQFGGDAKAGAMFVGKDCGLCSNPNWDTDSKNIGR